MSDDSLIRHYTAKAARLRKTLNHEGLYPTGNIKKYRLDLVVKKLGKLDREDLCAISGIIDLLADFPGTPEEKAALYQWACLDGQAAIAEARARETLAVAG